MTFNRCFCKSINMNLQIKQNPSFSVLGMNLEFVKTMKRTYSTMTTVCRQFSCAQVCLSTSQPQVINYSDCMLLLAFLFRFSQYDEAINL